MANITFGTPPPLSISPCCPPAKGKRFWRFISPSNLTQAPIDTIISALKNNGCSPKKSDDQWTAKCPAHDDRNPSLSVGLGKDGRVLIKCHAGCNTEDVVHRLGLGMRDLFSDWGDRSEAPTVLDCYDYTDAAGTLLYQVVRRWPKEFRQRRPDGAGRWIWKLEDVQRVLYRLPDLLAAVAAGQVIYIVEGEKDADALVKRAGVCATCNSGGAGKWRTEYAEVLRGAEVVIVADNDEPGLKHAALVRKHLVGVARSVRVVRAAAGKDAFDHLQAGHTVKEFIQLEDAVSPNAPGDGYPRVTRLSDVARKPVSWLWRGRIPLGKVTVLDGDPGVGKSTLIGDIAARVTTGRVMPDGESTQGPPATVILVPAEDDVAETIRPRMDAVGGASERVLVYPSTSLGLPYGVDELEQVVKEHQAVLVVIDPVTAHLSPEINPNSDVQVRCALQPLVHLAAATGVAVVLVRHLRKLRGPALQSGAGSMAFAGLARSVLLAAKNPTTGALALAVTKASLCEHPPSIGYNIVAHGQASAVEWLGPVATSADELTIDDHDELTEVEQASVFLRTEMADGDWHYSGEIKRAADAANIAPATLRRADKRVRVRKLRGSQLTADDLAGRDDSRWYWALPEPEPDPGDVAAEAKQVLADAVNTGEQHEQVLPVDIHAPRSEGIVVVAHEGHHEPPVEQPVADILFTNTPSMSNNVSNNEGPGGGRKAIVVDHVAHPDLSDDVWVDPEGQQWPWMSA